MRNAIFAILSFLVQTAAIAKPKKYDFELGPRYTCPVSTKTIKKECLNYKPHYKSPAWLTFDQDLLQYDLFRNQKQDLRLEDFELLQTVGSGYLSYVYLARYKPTGTYYALKRMSKFKIIEQGQTSRVYKEQAILEILNSPFILSYMGSFQDHMYIYMVTDFIFGGDLYEVMYKKKIKFKEVDTKFYFAQMVLAFEYIHSRRIIHRDIKPANVIVDVNGYVKLADFGFAKVLKKEEKSYCGTHNYMAPEIIAGTVHDFSADWYSLGVLLYEVLS